MNDSINYKDSGVDVEKGDQFVDWISGRVRSQFGATPERLVSGVGGFCSLFDLQNGKYLATGVDGVGTKIKMAQLLNLNNTVGIDLVAMCANDIICSGAKPLLFLDYLSTGKLNIKTGQDLLDGIIEGCRQANCFLVGGETAEMPGLYGHGEYDLAGFVVGEVEQEKVVTGKNIEPGDKLLALASSGFHSNGYSLLRRIILPHEKKLLEQCLLPTKIYVTEILSLLENHFALVGGISHITGGGIKNIPRMNKKLGYRITNLPEEQELPSIINEVRERSKLSPLELYTTFNMGMGMVLAVKDATAVQTTLGQYDLKSWVIGEVTKEAGLWLQDKEVKLS